MKGRNMVMVTTPAHNPLVNCIICGEPIKPDHATAGSLYADDRQAYACNTHLYNRRIWVPGWATFETTQQHVRNAVKGRTR